MKRMVGIGLTVLVVLSACTSTKPSFFGRSEGGWSAPTQPGGPTAGDGRDPQILPETYFAAGRLFEEQGQLAKAVVQYRKAVTVNHDFPAAYDRLGVVMGRLGRHEEAEACLRKAVELRPNWAGLRNNLGFEYVLQSRWKDAERELRTALNIQPGYERAHVNLAMALAKMDRFDEARENFQAALPETDAHYNLGLLLRGRQRYQEAAQAFQYVLALNPQFTAARTQLDSLQAEPRPSVAQPTNVVAWQENTSASGSVTPHSRPATVRTEPPSHSSPVFVEVMNLPATPEQSQTHERATPEPTPQPITYTVSEGDTAPSSTLTLVAQSVPAEVSLAQHSTPIEPIVAPVILGLSVTPNEPTYQSDATESFSSSLDDDPCDEEEWTDNESMWSEESLESAEGEGEYHEEVVEDTMSSYDDELQSIDQFEPAALALTRWNQEAWLNLPAPWWFDIFTTDGRETIVVE